MQLSENQVQCAGRLLLAVGVAVALLWCWAWWMAGVGGSGNAGEGVEHRTGMARPRQQLAGRGKPTASGGRRLHAAHSPQNSVRGDAAASDPELYGQARSGRVVAATGASGIDWVEWADGRSGLRFSAADVEIEERNSDAGRFSVVRGYGQARVKTAGAPALPVRRIDVVVAPGVEPVAHVVDGEYREVRVAPPNAALGFFSRGESASSIPRAPRPATGRGLVPASVVELTPPFRLRGVRGVGVLVRPFQYDFDRGVLRIWERIDVAVRGAAPSNASFSSLPSAFAEFARARFATATPRSGDNQGVSVDTGGGTRSAATRSLPDSQSCEPGRLVIVAPNEFVPALENFVAWKRERGFRTRIVVYPDDTGEGPASLRAALLNAYEQDAITHVMLVGDADVIPVHSSTGSPTDIRYACLEGDDAVRDVFLSRMSADTPESVAVQTARIVTYERTPEVAARWYEHGLFIGSNEGQHKSGSVFGKDDWEFLDEVREELLDYGYSAIDRYYEEDADNPDPFPWSDRPRGDILAALNEGRGLVYYLGHGTEGEWLTGSLRARHLANGLRNGARLPFVLDIACLNGDFTWTGGECIAETLMDPGAQVDGGAVGVIAATEDMDWDPPVVMMQAFTDQLASGTLRTAGALHTYAVQAAMDWCESVDGPGTPAAERIMEQAHLLGDPTLGIRTRRPRAVVVEHTGALAVNRSWRVTVTASSDGAAVAGADVVVSDASSGLCFTERTDSRGVAVFAAPECVGGAESVLLTVYGSNLLPVQEEVPVNAGPLHFANDGGLSSAVTGEFYEDRALAVGGAGNYEWSLAGTLPSGLTFDPESGMLSGTPGEVGEWPLRIEAVDADNASTTMDFVLQVGSPVRVAAQVLPGATVGEAYSHALVCNDGMPPVAWSIADGALPSGLTLTECGMVTGTPRRAGESSFSVSATGAAGSSDSADIRISVAPNSRIHVLTTELPAADSGAAYSVDLIAAGGSGGGYAWSVSDGDLPAGLVLSSNGRLSGTPVREEFASFTVTVVDDATPANRASVDLSLTVRAAVRLPRQTLPDGRAGTPYEARIEATGSHRPFRFGLAPVDPEFIEHGESTFEAVAEDVLRAPDHHWVADEWEWTLDLPFAFPFFGRECERVRVGDNGYVVLAGASPDPKWQAGSEELGLCSLIAPFWSDLTFPNADGKGVFVRLAAESVTILWRGNDYHENEDELEFALTLHSDGRAVFLYGDIATTNRVAVGISDANAPHCTAVYSHQWNQSDPHGVEGWSNHGDIAVGPSCHPSWLALSTDGVLSGVPERAGLVPVSVHVTDAAGHSDTLATSFQVRSVPNADADQDGEVENDEILAYIGLWKNGVVDRADVENAISSWRTGPSGESRTRGAEEAGTVRSAEPARRNAGGNLDPNSPGLERARRVRSGAASPSVQETPRSGAVDGYRDSSEIDELLVRVAEEYPDLCRRVELGVSGQGRPISALVITDFPEEKEPEPVVGVLGAMHGDEPVSAEVPLRLASHLLSRYHEDAAARALVDNTELWVVPCLNPDGRDANSRFLDGGMDLNRAFPDGIEDSVGTPWQWSVPAAVPRSPEATAIMDWAARVRPSLVVSFHSGATVVCYPYGNSPDGRNTHSVCPDDDLFQSLGTTYAADSTYIAMESFAPRGVVNGAAWYAVEGEMTDWLYRSHGALAMTVELADEKAPAPGEIEGLWQWNRSALMNLLSAAQSGVDCTVVDAVTGTGLAARLSVEGRDQPVFSHPSTGYGHRYLPAGTHVLRAEAPGYRTESSTVRLDTSQTVEDRVFALERSPWLALRRFEQPAYSAGQPLEVRVALKMACGQPAPPAVIVTETIPDQWEYVDGSTHRSGTLGTGPGEPRRRGQTCSWLLWGDQVANGSFRFEWRPNESASKVATFEGELATEGSRTPVLGRKSLRPEAPAESGFHLQRGWNLVSLDLEPVNASPEAVFDEMERCPTIWTWENGRYIHPARLEPGRGYWVYSTGVCTVRYSGAYAQEQSAALPRGWSLIGPLDEIDPFVSRTEIRKVHSFMDSTYRSPAFLERGRGYWVLSDAEVDLSLR